jgi:uncharacterized OB-fold protein
MEIPRHWRLNAQRYRLEGSACPTCGQLAFPPRQVCPQCTAPTMQIADYGFSELPTKNRIVDIVSSR